MANRKISGRDRFLLIVLALVLVGVCYYMFFLKPLQADLADIASQSEQVDQDMMVASAKVGSMKKMQDELDAIFASAASKSDVTEIAPYDNAKVVMSQLNGILSASENYSLVFRDPEIEDNGFVRRQVSMTFDCEDYASAKRIIEALSASHWRCLINSLSLKTEEEQLVEDNTTAEKTAEKTAEETGDVAITQGLVTITATITFFESTKIA